MQVLCLVAAAPSGGGASFTRVGKSFDSSLQHVYQLSNDIHTADALPCAHHKLQTQHKLDDKYVPVDIPQLLYDFADLSFGYKHWEQTLA